MSCLVLCSVAGMHYAGTHLVGGDDMVCWHSMLTGVSSWACPFYAQSCTRDDLLVSILSDRERVKGEKQTQLRGNIFDVLEERGLELAPPGATRS